jgi:hypothetical protein
MLWLLCILIGLVLGQFITISINSQAQEWVLLTVPKLVERFTNAAAPLLDSLRDRAMVASAIAHLADTDKTPKTPI